MAAWSWTTLAVVLMAGLCLVHVESQEMSSSTPSTVTPSTPAPPVPTTTPAPSPPVTPYPLPAQQGKWSLNSTDTTAKSPCLIMEFTLEFKVDYFDTSKKQIGTGVFYVPQKARISGSCPASDDHFNATLQWPNPNNISQTLEFDFQKNSTPSQEKPPLNPIWFINEIKLNFTYDNGTFTHINESLLNKHVLISLPMQEFQAGANHSYRCSTPQTIKVNNNTSSSSVNASFDFSGVQIDAFRDTTKDESRYNPGDVCELDRAVSDVVPIAVGCALAALVIIVIIAYIIGRQRSRQRGYQSV